MERAACIELGYIAKAHGIQGQVKAVFDVMDIREYAREKQFYLGKGEEPLFQLQVERFQITGDQAALITFAEIKDRDAAEALRGHTLFFPEDELPALPKGHFYYFEVIGFQVVDAQLGPLGTVKAFMDGVAQDLLVMDYQGHEVLIPMTDDFVGLADMEAQTLATNLPEGLIEMYIE